MTRPDRVALGAALAIPWLFIWQGLDLTDQGYALTNYRSFWHHPEATADSSALWLTNFIGSIWNAIFGGLGVVSMRGLWALCLSLGLFLAFRFVRSVTSARAAAWAVLAASIFLSDRRETWFSYNTSTSLLLVAAAICLIKGIVEQRPRLLFGAGVWIGVLPFARFPNVLALGLLAALGLAAYLDAARRPRWRRDLGISLLGVAAGICAMLALILLRGDAKLVFEGVRDLFTPAAQAAGYDSGELLTQFLNDSARAVVAGLVVCASGVALSRVLSDGDFYGNWVLVLSLGVLSAWGLSKGDERWRYFVTGTTYWVLGAVALGLWRRSFDLRIACFVALLVVLIAPLGSGNGIKNAHVGLWLGLPLMLALLFEVEAPRLAGHGSKVAVVLAIALCGEGLHRATTYTYRDQPRARLTTPVNHPQLRGQYTTDARAKIVEEVLDALDERVAPGDYLLAYEGTPLLHYLTKTNPYLNTPWLMSAGNTSNVHRLLLRAPKRKGCLPVAVMALKSTRGDEWPEANNRLEQREPIAATRQAVRTFLRRHGYEQTWKNSFFVILEPPPDKRRACR